MDFTGKYELESQENYEEFLEAIGFSNAKTEHKVLTEVVQDGDDFTWTQTIPGFTWSNTFTVEEECELKTMAGSTFMTTATLDEGKLSMKFPEYRFTAELKGDKLLMNCTTPGQKGVTLKRVSKRV